MEKKKEKLQKLEIDSYVASVEMNIEEGKRFEADFVNTYLILKSRMDSELATYSGLLDKLDFLQELKDTILKKISQAKGMYGISESSLSHVQHLNGLYRTLVDILVMLTPYSGHTDPPKDFGQKDNFMTILQFFP